MFSSAADARKRPAKCAIAHEQVDDKADVVLLDIYKNRNGGLICTRIGFP